MSIDTRNKITHLMHCQFVIASTCPIPVECEHGYDVCPICDPCHCQEKIHAEKN